MKLKVKESIGILILSIFVLSGCAANLDLSYMPQSKSPLMTVKPMTIALQVEDHRIPEEKEIVGKKRKGMVTAQVKSNKEVTLVIYDALKNELENNGHKIIDTKEANHDASIKVILNRYWSDFYHHFFDFEMIGIINVEVSIQNQDGSVLFSKAINSTFRESRQIATDRAYYSVLNGVLVEFTRNFSRDPGVLKALNDIQQDKI